MVSVTIEENRTSPYLVRITAPEYQTEIECPTAAIALEVARIFADFVFGYYMGEDS